MPSNLVRSVKLTVGLAAAFLASTAFAGRYWLGGEGYWLDTAKWAESASTTGGASVPDSSGGTVYFNNGGTLVFDGSGNIGSSDVKINSGTSSDPVVWSASDSSCGLTTTGKIRVGADSAPAALKIEGGTYSATAVYVPRKDASEAYGLFVFNGGRLTVSDSCYVGYKANTVGEFVLNDGDIIVNKDVFYLGEGGTGRFTMNGGTFTMQDSGYGFCICHDTDGSVAELTLNGGVMTTPKFRIDKLGSAESGTIVFNGGTLKATRKQDDYIAENSSLSCVLQSGGLILDTAGFDVTIAHEFTGSGPLIKKGAGTLTVADGSKFTDIIVYAGTAVVGGTTYEVNAEAAIDASAGGDLGEVVIHGEKLEGWLKDADYTNVGKYNAYGTAQLEQPVPVIIDVNGNRKTYINLETGTTYNDTINNVAFSFTTEDLAPRTLKILSTVDSDPVENVRDVGSWPLMGNAKMKQGVILRGGHLDHFVNSTAEQKAASALAGLKSEIDLRMIELGEVASEYQGVTKSWAAVDADYVYCPINYNTGGSQISSNDPNFTNQIRRVFSTLGNAENLPSYFHCRIGTDRTGIVGLLLLGMMGVEEEVLYRDYLMSNFANIGGSRDSGVPETFLRYILRGNCNSDKYVYNTKDGEYGSSVASRCRQYLEMCGVTEAQLAVITDALSGETPAEVLARVNAYETANNVRTVSYVPYEGSTSTNATHRLPAGANILPASDPTRDGYIFKGWDTANEANGIVYALWSVDSAPKTRFWSDANGVSEKFNRAESWDAAPGSMSEVVVDTLVLNKGTDKVATFETGDVVSTSSLYIGEGDGNLGGRLEISGGTLTVTNYFRMGVDGAAPATNIVNISGGSFLANNIRTGHCDSQNGVYYDELNVSNGGCFESAGGETRLSDGSTGLSYMNIIDGGLFKAAGTVFVGYSGKAVVSVADSVFDMNGKHLYVGNSSGSEGEVVLSNITTEVKIDQLRIANSSGSVGKMEVSGEDTVVNSSYAVYIGKHGNGELTINGGLVSAAYAVQFGDDDSSGNTGVLNLNGGTLKVPQVNLHGNTTGVLNWNGGILKRGNNTFVANGEMCPANLNLTVRVLEGGAFYEGSDTYAFSQPISGVGAFTKLGSGTLTLAGAVSLKGGFKVEAGTLNVTNITRTYFKAIEVAGDASLNLNGAEVTVERYVYGQTEYGPGTYSEHGGVIHVVVPAGGDPVTAVWVDSLGDGDLNSPDNWIVRNSDGQVLNDALPNANTAVYVFVGTVRPDFSGITVKSVTLVASGETFMRGDCSVPAVVRQANGWYDFDDAATVALSGETAIASVANKGAAGSALDAFVFGNDGDAAPLYGVESNKLNGRSVMSMTTSDDDTTRRKGLQTAELGLTNNQDRALVVLSRRGDKTPHYPLGIETQDNTDFWGEKSGHFRIQRFGYFSGFLYYGASETTDDGFKYEGKTLGQNGLAINDWTISLFQSEEKNLTGFAWTGSGTPSLHTATTLDMNTKTEARLYIGHAQFDHDSVNHGQVAEAMYFDHALTEEEMTQIRTYLAAKWFTPADMSNIPPNILLENNATLDFGGGNWTFDTVKGAGTIGTANVTVMASIEPGLTVGGAVTFANGATIDMSAYNKTPAGTLVTFLTADSVVGWPRKVKSKSRSAALRLVDNGNGTVSLVGELAAVGFSVRLR